jgi:dienelactone hydrolase
MRRLLGVLLVMVGTTAAHAELKTKVIEYKHEDKTLEGYLAYDDAATGKRPGVLVFHDWTGHNPFARKRAEQLAGLGYVAFAVDTYGKGVLARDPKEAAAMAAVYKNDRKLMRARAAAGLEVLKSLPQVDAQRLGAIGYCFGGTCALELARSGADLAGLVSFHGGLATPHPEDAKNVKGKVLALHGAAVGRPPTCRQADGRSAGPFVPADEVAGFEDEMRKAKVDWELVKYGGAVHGYTNPDAGKDPSKGAAYNESADRRSWQAMKDFFAEVFGK